LPWLHRTYGKLLIVDKPYLGYITMAVLLLAGVGIWPFLGQELLPSFKERDFLMHWLAKPGTSHPEMVRISQAACQELQTIPGVRNCGSHIGQALLMDEVYGIYFGENWVSVDPSVDYDQTLASIQSLVDGYPGLFRDVQTYLKERIREVLTGTSDAVVVRIYGDDLEVLRAKAAEVEAEMLAIDGLIDVHQELLLDIPQIQIQVDLARAQKYGLKPGDVRRAASYLLAGEEAGDLHTANRTFDVNVWSTPENRHSLNSIQDLLIDTPSGKQVRLTEVADVRIVPVANAINREDLSRRIHVEANVASVGPDLGSVVAEVEAALERVDFPLGYHPELLGEFAERQAAQRNLLNVAAFAALGILFLLWISFKSWRLAGLAFLTLITTLMGGVVAAYLGGGVLSLGSLVGFLTVLGISARNKILLINHYQHLEQFEGETFGPALVRRGSRERVAPILMTALTTGLALVPLVIAGNLPGHEIEHPMAIVILGGLITSALTNLFVVPSLYLRFGGGSKPQPEMTSTLSSQPAPAAR
jgi:Cu/Ag efflux pump CusA